MENNIEVSQELYKFFVPGETEWGAVHSHKITVDNIDYMFIPISHNFSVVLIVLEVTSGMKITELWVDPFEFLECNTKELTLKLLAEKALLLQKMVNDFGKDKVVDTIRSQKLHFETKLGPMPKIELSDEVL